MMISRPMLCSLLAVALGIVPWSGLRAQAPAAPTAPAVPTAPLTVEEAVRFALANNPAVTLAEQQVQIAEAQLDVARANGRPDVTVNATGTWNPSPSSITLPGGDDGGSAENRTFQIGAELSVSAQLNAVQPVWPPSRWRAPVAAARANVGVNQESLTRTRQQIAFETRQAFFQLLSARELLQVAEDAVTVARGQLRLAETQVAAGVAAPLDIFQARATLADAEVSLVRARNGVDVARAALATRLGLPANTPIQITPPAGLPAATDNVDPLVAAALSQRPELAQINYRREQQRAAIELIRLQTQPLVNIQGTYNQSLIGGSLFGGEGFTLSAVASLSLYNGGQTSAELEAARIQLAQLDTTASQLELGIRLEVRQAWLNLRNALEQLTAAQRQLDAATEALRIAQIRYDAGEGILLEVEQARLRQTQARTSLAQARLQAEIADAQLSFAIGSPAVAEAPAAL